MSIPNASDDGGGAADHIAHCAFGATPDAGVANATAKTPYSPYAARKYPTQPFFGDTHLHTSFSMDAGAFGARLTPTDAYVFAKGDEVMASSGQPAKLARPSISSLSLTTPTAWASFR